MTDTLTTNRGRKPKSFAFPAGEFKVKDLAQQLGISVPTVHIRIRAAGDKIKRTRKEQTNRKGRAAWFYEFVNNNTPNNN